MNKGKTARHVWLNRKMVGSGNGFGDHAEAAANGVKGQA